jgi:hypothetical protein
MNTRQERTGMPATGFSNRDFVDAVAQQLSIGVECAVEGWMAQIENTFNDTRLTTLGRMNAIQGILETYRQSTGKTRLYARTA